MPGIRSRREDVFCVADFESRLRFPVCKLIDRLEEAWRNDHSLPVQIARAQIAALRTARDPQGRYRAKWQLVRNLYDQGYNADELREIFRLIDEMMRLREDLDREFEHQLSALEESLDMPYITSVERIAEARGVASVVLRQLPRRCGPLPEDLKEHIRQMPIDRLMQLGEALFDLQGLGDLQGWLDTHGKRY